MENNKEPKVITTIVIELFKYNDTNITMEWVASCKDALGIIGVGKTPKKALKELGFKLFLKCISEDFANQ